MNKKLEFGPEQLRLLGQRLRVLRQARNLSLRRLAGDSGVSITAIQDLEAGSSSPSLVNVLSIAEILGEPVDRLIAACMEPSNPVQIVRGSMPGRAAKRGASVGLLHEPRMRSAILIVPSTSKLADADAPTDVPMFAYVLEGAVELEFSGGRQERLAVNDAIHIAQEPPTLWSNSSSKRAAILCVALLSATVE
jgi:transcriptional regulator with XRE-family HTH domain